MNGTAAGLKDREHHAIEGAVAGVRGVFDSSGVLWLPDDGVLVVSDLHLEKGAAFARRGRLIPPYDSAATLARLAAVITRYEPRAVISLGDSFHDGVGAAMMPPVYRDALASLALGRDWYWIAGNHDPDPPAGLPGDCVGELAVAGLTFRHEPLRGAGAGEIAGHLHPGARVIRRGRSIRRPCFATDGKRLVMPAFGAFTGTLNVLDKAWRGIFRREELTAYLMGPGRLYPIPGSSLAAG